MMEGPDRVRARAYTTDFVTTPHHDIGQVYSGIHHNVRPYSTSGGLSYVSNNSYMQYSNVPTTYSPFPTTFAPSPDTSQAAILFSYSRGGQIPYSVQPPPRSATLPSQPRVFSRGYSSSSVHPHHSAGPMYLRASFDYSFFQETEEQDSVNSDSGKSEPIEPALEGYPNVHEFDDLMKHYVAQLSPKKQDKALINAARASNIKYVLSNKKTTTVESAQFRFWAKKMFQLQPTTGSVPMERRKICHENKPIAVREKLFKILTRAHQKCQHGGRDKTSAQVRKVYSWVPKELISRFVKLCPTCRERRGAMSSADDDGIATKVTDVQATTTMTTTTPSFTNVSSTIARSSPEEIRSPLKRRRSPSLNEGRITEVLDMPAQLANCSQTFQNQNRWLSDFPPRSTYDDQYTTAAPYPLHKDFRDFESSIKMCPGTLLIKQDTPQDAKHISIHSSQQQELHYAYD